MSGQSANLSLKEACAMQHRVQASGSHASNNGGGRSMGGAKATKKPHTEAKYEPSKMEGK